MQPLCGYVHEEPHPSHPRWGDVAGSIPITAGPFGDIDLREHLPPVWSQLAQDCCAVATRTAAFATAAAAGTPIPLPSCAYLYAIARLRMGPPPLVDEGSSLPAMFAGMALTGLVAESRWPEDLATINNIPPVDALEAGQSATISASYFIPPGTGLDVGLVSALQRSRYPVIAMPVDQAFAAMADGVYSAQGGDVLGGHAMVVVGYVAALDAFILRNSWGPNFGDNGDVMISRALLVKLAVGGWVIDVAPGGAP